MREYWVFYSLETGEFNGGWGEGEPGYAALQTIPEGMGRMVVPRQALSADGKLDLVPVKDSLAASVDLAADNVRGIFTSNTSGQYETYRRKEAEARHVLLGDTSDTPFLTAEAAAIGVDIHDLAQQVVDQADQWIPLAASIEAARRKAKVAMSAAVNLKELAEAVKIDWKAVTTPTESDAQ